MDLRGVTTPGTHSPKLSASLEQGDPHAARRKRTGGSAT